MNGRKLEKCGSGRDDEECAGGVEIGARRGWSGSEVTRASVECASVKVVTRRPSIRRA
jgi:hypothetical protein